MTGSSFFLIKPDGFPHKNEIKKLFRTVGLNIVTERDFDLDQKMARELFPQTIKMENYEALMEYLCEGRTNAGIVEGYNVIKTLANICGIFTEPEDNSIGTIRRLFGKGYTRTASGLYVVRNAIHRSKSQEQAEMEISWYKKNR